MVSPTAKDKGTIRSHSVWRFYLQQFSPDDRMIFALDVETSREYRVSIKDASVCKDIYFLEQELSENDVFFIKRLAGKNYPLDERDEKNIDEIIGFLNNDPSPFMDMGEEGRKFFKSKIREYIGDNALRRNQEELFTYYENNFIPLYEKLLKKDSSFYNEVINDKNALLGYMAALGFKTSNFLHSKFFDLLQRIQSEYGMDITNTIKAREGLKNGLKKMEEDLGGEFPFAQERYFSIYYFIIFILSQYLRTRKHFQNDQMYDALERNAEENFPQYKGIFNYKNIMAMIVHYQTYRIGVNFVDEKKFRIVFLETNTGAKFITSDQPIINTYAALQTEKAALAHHELEFYYPLSPDLAILFTDRDCYKDAHTLTLDKQSVDAYNDLIKKSCLKTIYSKYPFSN